MSLSSDVIKYGDVEKEKEIEKRLKELGLWGSKVHQEKEVEKMLDKHIGNCDKLTHVIRRARRRRERSSQEDDDRSKEQRDRRSDGMKTMDEIRNIVKPTIVRDREGTPLAYHIDVIMGCFTYDVAHHVTNDGYTVILFGATSPLSPLASLSFLSSKSLPSLFSPVISPRSASPPKISSGVKYAPDVIRPAVDSGGLGSTLRYRKGHERKTESVENDEGNEGRVDGVRRLTKEISVELPRTVDVSQLIVDFRKSVFKIRVPFFLEHQNSNHQSMASLPHDSSKFSSSLLDPIKCQTSNLSSSSPSSPSLYLKPSCRPIPSASLSSSPAPLSPAPPSSRAFHCSVTPHSKTTPLFSEQSIVQNPSLSLNPFFQETPQFRQTSSPPFEPPKETNNFLLLPVDESARRVSHSDGLLTVLPKQINKKAENESESHTKQEYFSSPHSFNSKNVSEIRRFDVSQPTLDHHLQARYNGSKCQRSSTSGRDESHIIRNEVSGGVNNQTIVQTVEHSLKFDKKESDSKSCGKNEDVVHSLFYDFIKSKNSNRFEESIDDLVLINSLWSDDVDLDSLLKHCVQLPRKVKRSRTEEIPIRDLSLWHTGPNNVKTSKNCKKIRSKSLPGSESTFPHENILSINRESVAKQKFLKPRVIECRTSDIQFNPSISDENVDSLLDMLEESKV